jgi:hypothetical protein
MLLESNYKAPKETLPGMVPQSADDEPPRPARPLAAQAELTFASLAAALSARVAAPVVVRAAARCVKMDEQTLHTTGKQV